MSPLPRRADDCDGHGRREEASVRSARAATGGHRTSGDDLSLRPYRRGQTTASFPEGVISPAQYGPRVRACAPLPRPMQLHAIKPHLHAMAVRVLRNRATGGKQRQLPVVARVFVERLDHPTPGFVLAVVDLAEIQHLALRHLPGHAAAVLNNIPIPMFLAVFQASVEAREHDAQFTPSPNGAKGTWSTLQTIRDPTSLFRLAFLSLSRAKIAVRQPELRKLG